LNAKLVDAVAAPDKVSELVMKEIGAVLPVSAPAVDRPEKWERPGIAIVYIDGDITDGASRSIPFLGQKLAGGGDAGRGDHGRAQRSAGRRDHPAHRLARRQRAPRPSYLARGLRDARREADPVLDERCRGVGGYFVAGPACEAITADPMTMPTGSIGIFYGKVSICQACCKASA